MSRDLLASLRAVEVGERTLGTFRHRLEDFRYGEDDAHDERASSRRNARIHHEISDSYH